MIQQLSEANGNMNCPGMIVVAIPNIDRTRDLTPTHIASDLPNMDSNSSKNTGGGENFVAFMEKTGMENYHILYSLNPAAKLFYSTQNIIQPEAMRKMIFNDPFIGRLYK